MCGSRTRKLMWTYQVQASARGAHNLIRVQVFGDGKLTHHPPRARRMGVARTIGYDARVAIGSTMSLPAMDRPTLRGRHVRTFNRKEFR